MTIRYSQPVNNAFHSTQIDCFWGKARKTSLQFLVSLCLTLFYATAHGQNLALSATEMTNLGVKYMEATPVLATTSQHFPAQVSVPNSQRHIVQTTQEGVVDSILVAEGDRVKKDQILASVNSPQLITLQTEFLNSYSQLSQASTDMARDKQLFEEGIIAERRYLDTNSRFQQQKTVVDSYLKTMQLAGMDQQAINDLRQYRKLDSTLQIRATTDGVVMAQHAVIGQRLVASDVLYEVADLSSLWLEIHVPLSIARTIEPSSEVNTCDRDVKATVLTIGKKVHDIDQGVLVRAETLDHADQLTPGEFVEVCFVKQSTTTLYDIPQNAVLRMDGQARVFTYDGQTIQLQAIHIVSQTATTITVSDAFLASTKLIFEGIAALKSAWLAQGEN